MRDYAKVEPKMWHGQTMKALRKHPEALVVSLYLMTSPSSNMLGLFSQPIMYMAYETGLGIEGATKGLEQCCSLGFCSYDPESEFVWVHEMARYQIAHELKATDLRCKGIQKDYEALPDNPFLGPFFDRYAEAFHLSRRRGGEGATEAPSKAHRSQEQEQEKEQEQEQEKKPSASSPAKLPTCPTDRLVDLYHQVLPELPRVRLATEGRKRALQKVWAWCLTSKRGDGTPRAQTPDEAVQWFREYFDRARQNDFLMGRTPRSGEHANWRCDLDFLLTERGMKHVIEKTLEAA